MNRTIKYRIWDKECRRFITENECSLHCFSNWAICPFTGKLFDYVGDISNPNTLFTQSPDPNFWMDKETVSIQKGDRYVLQQYTELNDMNGTDIYEGDIVRNATKEDISMWGKENVYSVYFSSGAFGLVHKTGTMGYTTIGQQGTSQLVVIGNIFETPELLK